MSLAKVTKIFHFESAHRLPWHTGGCKNLHGHSYKLEVELEGEPDEKGMLLDFSEIKKIIKPLIDNFDHATLIAANDQTLIKSMTLLESKRYILPFDTTSENLCSFVINHFYQNGLAVLTQHKIQYIRVKVQETESCYAEMRRSIHELSDRTTEQQQNQLKYATH